MKLLNIGVDSAKHDTQELIEALQAQRSAVLERMRELQLASRLLVQAEAQRLARRDASDARIASLAKAERVTRDRVALLDTEIEVAAIRVPPATKTDALVHGRITDELRRGAGGVTVRLVRADGSPVAGVQPAAVDASGYYAFVLDPQAVATIRPDEKLSVVVQRDDSAVVPAAAAGFTLAAGTVAVKDVALNDAELQRLRLRPDLATSTGVPPTAPPRHTATAAPPPAADPAKRSKAVRTRRTPKGG
jgi:predicted nucleic acid-binding protein